MTTVRRAQAPIGLVAAGNLLHTLLPARRACSTTRPELRFPTDTHPAEPRRSFSEVKGRA